MKPKEMIYKKERSIELLYNDIYHNFHYYILNLGTHPTAYIEIPKHHKFYEIDYFDIPDKIKVHGGFTYSSNRLKISESTIMENSWFLGWDYAHYGDYLEMQDFLKLNIPEHKYTTEEIIEECKIVIEQIEKELKEEGKNNENN